MSDCTGSGATYLRLSEPLSILCPRCMRPLHPWKSGRVEWTLPRHDREGRLKPTTEAEG